jgi:hypothetical protein
MTTKWCKTGRRRCTADKKCYRKSTSQYRNQKEEDALLEDVNAEIFAATRK